MPHPPPCTACSTALFHLALALICASHSFHTRRKQSIGRGRCQEARSRAGERGSGRRRVMGCQTAQQCMGAGSDAGVQACRRAGMQGAVQACCSDAEMQARKARQKGCRGGDARIKCRCGAHRRRPLLWRGGLAQARCVFASFVAPQQRRSRGAPQCRCRCSVECRGSQGAAAGRAKHGAARLQPPPQIRTPKSKRTVSIWGGAQPSARPPARRTAQG